jgi:hypothetical protein
VPILSEKILDERRGPDTTPADAAEIELGTPPEDFEFEAAANSILDRVRGEVRAQARTDVDERLAEWPTVANSWDWKPFALGVGVGAGLVYVSQIVNVVLSHLR